MGVTRNPVLIWILWEAIYCTPNNIIIIISLLTASWFAWALNSPWENMMSLKLEKYLYVLEKSLICPRYSPWIFVKAPFANKKVWKCSCTQICDCISCYFISNCGEIEVLKKLFWSLKSPWITPLPQKSVFMNQVHTWLKNLTLVISLACLIAASVLFISCLLYTSDAADE